MEIDSLDISSFDFFKNPYFYYEKLRVRNPDVHFLSKNGCYLVIGFGAAAKVLGTPKIYSSKFNEVFDSVLIGSDPPVHTTNRKILTEEHDFLKTKLEDYIRVRIEDIASYVLNQTGNKQVTDVVRDFAYPLSTLIIFEMLGLDISNDKIIKEWTYNAVLNINIHNIHNSEHHWQIFKPVVEAYIDKKENSSVFLNQKIRERFSREELISVTKIFLTGGNETTPKLITSCLNYLIRNKSLWNLVKTNEDALEQVIHEILRLEAPVQIINRIATEDTSLGGVQIPKGSVIFVSLAAANRDPRVFDSPNDVILHRDKQKILSFGYGPHHCIGASLAKTETKIALKKFISHFKEPHLLPISQQDYIESSHVRGLKYLYVQDADSVKKVSNYREKAVDLLEAQLKEYNHFPTFEFYPDFESKKHKGWHYTYPSPFIHANVICSLLNTENEQLISLAKKGKPFLLETKESGDLWRFWKTDNCQHPVPFDIDDTAVCSFALEKMGHAVKNKKRLLRNIKDDGTILTWFKSHFKLSDFCSPKSIYKAFYEKKAIRYTYEAKMFDWQDSEAGVASSALMYLNNIPLEKSVEKCISLWRNNDSKHNFYDKKIVVAYHIARAYKEGIQSFDVLRAEMEAYIQNNLDYFEFAELLFACLTLKYLKLEEDTYKKTYIKIINYALGNPDDLFSYYPYFTSKDHVFYAGSRCLTAAMFLEVTKDYDLSPGGNDF